MTGASGNIGSVLVSRLLSEGDEVTGISRGTRPCGHLTGLGAHWHLIDVGGPDARTALAKAFAGVDAVVHLAWTMPPRADPARLRSANVLGSATVAGVAAGAGVPHLVHLSSTTVYSPRTHATAASEYWPVTGIPRSTYSMNKACAENYLDGLSAAMRITRLRPALVLHGDTACEVARYVLGRFVPPWLAHPDLVDAPWPAGMQLQFVDLEDVADAIVRALRRRATGAFNLAADPPVDDTMMKQICGEAAADVPHRAIPEETWFSWSSYLQPGDPGWLALALRTPLVRTERARAVLGWQPRVGAQELLHTFLNQLACSARDGSVGGELHELSPRTRSASAPLVQPSLSA